MVKIIEDVKSRIEKCQTSEKKKEFRRCNTDLRPNIPIDVKKPDELVIDEKEKLRKELNASLAARKSLEVVCSSLGKEKEIIASELARKVQEMNDMEELINDLKVQNEKLSAKVLLNNPLFQNLNGWKEINLIIQLYLLNLELHF